MNLKLKRIWINLVNFYSDDVGLIVDFYNQIVDRYSEPHRSYHTLTHLSSMFDDLDGLNLNQRLSSTHCVYFATWFHDIIYMPGSSTNEKDSATFAESALKSLSVPLEIIELITTMINCTAQHENPSQSEFTQLFLDADMAILGVSNESYLLYTESIKFEFKLVPSSLYRDGRKKFLENTLNMNRIFHTDYFYTRYEQQARVNLKQELSLL
jgi:predicted metal-dependent HD superfamily phosphohydrolase